MVAVVGERRPAHGNYAARMLELFAAYGDDPAVVCGARRLSYTQLRDRVLDFAELLSANGIRPGTGLAVLVGNTLEAIVIQLGAHLIGCRTAWITPEAPHRQQVEFLRRARVDALVHDAPAGAADLDQLSAAVAGLRVLRFEPDTVRAARPGHLPTTVPADAPVTVLQTSGTTSGPKLVQHGARFFETLLSWSDDYVTAGEPRLRHLGVSWVCHVSGLMAAMMTLCTGGTWYPVPEFDVDGILRIIETERITSVYLTPPQLYQVLDSPRLARTDTASLSMLSVGGGPAAPARLAQAIDAFGPVLRITYGSTEAAFISAYPGMGTVPADADRLSSCGKPFGDMRVEVRDGDGRVLPPLTAGAIWVAGALTMLGYWDDRPRTESSLVDGWVCTGDVGYLDPDGYLYLVDRSNDMIITGLTGTNVYCRPVEDRLSSHPLVREAAVIGVPDGVYGAAVYAFVVPTGAGALTAADLHAWVTDGFNEEWAPVGVAFVDALPLTARGKVDKQALQARYRTGRC